MSELVHLLIIVIVLCVLVWITQQAPIQWAPVKWVIWAILLVIALIALLPFLGLRV